MIPAAQRLDSIQTYFFAKKLEEIRQMNLQGKDVINLGIGSPDLIPPQKVIARLVEGLELDGAHKYQSYYGLNVLREAFAKFYKRHFEITLNPNTEILPLMGSKEGIMHISMSYLNPGDEVLIPDPGYPTYKACALLARAKTKNYQLSEENNWLPNLEALEKEDLSKVKIMWINYPHMPSGSTITKSSFSDLVSFAERHNILLCNDNPYAFILNKTPLSILENTSKHPNVIELFSLSKSFNMAGWRIGALLGPEDIIKTVIKFKSNMDSGMFKPLQLAAAKALEMKEDWFENQNRIYSERKKIAHQILDSLECKYRDNQVGLFVWAKVPSHNSTYWSDMLLQKANVFLSPGIIFGSQGDQYLRISLCNDEQRLNESLKRIKTLL